VKPQQAATQLTNNEREPNNQGGTLRWLDEQHIQDLSVPELPQQQPIPIIYRHIYLERFVKGLLMQCSLTVNSLHFEPRSTVAISRPGVYLSPWRRLWVAGKEVFYIYIA